MQPNLFKKTCQIEMFKKLIKYLNKNYNKDLSTNLEKLFRDIQQNREIISRINRTKPTKDQLEQNKLILITYLNEILTLKSKIIFGKQSYTCSICFKWTDTIKKEEWESYNIYFEIYNCIYNLAVTFYSLGNYYANIVNFDKILKKEAVKNYKNALGLFSVLKQEAYNRISEKELPYDLYPSHLEYLEKLCIIFGQIEIFKIIEFTKKSEFLLQAKLLKCISENCSIAFKLSNSEPSVNGGEDKFRNFINNRVSYYLACVYQKLKNNAQKNFSDSGKGYGEILLFQKKYVQQLLECQKTIDECGEFANSRELNNELKNEKEIEKKMIDLNNKNYHQDIPENFKVELDSKDLMIPELPDDLHIGKNKDKVKKDSEKLYKELELLIPSQYKEIIDRYKKNMKDYFQDNINKYEEEKSSIESYINKLDLPRHLTEKKECENISKGSIELPFELWDKIDRVQKIGGIKTLKRMMDKILKLSNDLLANLQKSLKAFENEEKDDYFQREKFGLQWARKPSNELNKEFITKIKNRIKNLYQSKKFDSQQNNDIINNTTHFEKICSSKEKLTNDIPGRVVEKKSEINNEEILHEEILKLYILEDKINDIFSFMLEQLNDDSIITNMFIEVFEKNTSEQEIFNKSKEDLEKKFKQLEKLSDDVSVEKKKIIELTQIVKNSILENKNKNLSENTKKYFNELDTYVNLYIDYYKKISNGEKYYLNLEKKIKEDLQKSDKWMIERSENKKELINKITKCRKRANTSGKLI